MTAMQDLILFISIFLPPNLTAGGQLGQPGPCGAFELRGFPQQAGKGLDQEDYDVFGAGLTLKGHILCICMFSEKSPRIFSF